MKALTHAISAAALFVSAGICIATECVASRIDAVQRNAAPRQQSDRSGSASSRSSLDDKDVVEFLEFVGGVSSLLGFVLLLFGRTPAPACLGAGFLIGGVCVFSGCNLLSSPGDRFGVPCSVGFALLGLAFLGYWGWRWLDSAPEAPPTSPPP
jgi:hypothetical protein